MRLRFVLVQQGKNQNLSVVERETSDQGGDGHPPREFVTTRWSLILSATSWEEQKAREALAELCRIYWRPTFSFVRRWGYSIEDAKDLTQEFFAMILKDNWLGRADRDRGRFRSFLLRSLRNFLINAAERTSARKRGGDVQFVSVDDWTAEQLSRLSVRMQAFETLPPEQLFDLAWAATVAEHALQRLREECESKGKLWLFQALSPHLTKERDEFSYSELSARLGVNEAALKKQLHHMRRRYRSLLRTEVSQTVDKPSEVDDEIRYLCACLARGID
ncbi:MAG: sigma-70 family RNA polymerase sigma factor [Chthoniobacterales bacterium]|nr:sigma-70 family RNA polymerase sigma factor [Chthoniobacterales bacterium]